MLAIAVLSVAAIGTAASAKADNIDNVVLDFESGAVFTGQIDFANDYSSITGVNGTLTGYEYGISGFTGIGSDAISWVYGLCGNCSGLTGDQFGGLLMDGAPDGTGGGTYSNFIAFTYDYTNAPNLVLLPVSGNIGTDVDYDDFVVSSSIAPTPEPGSMVLLGSGLLALFCMAARKQSLRMLPAITARHNHASI
jgi:hypothetical protein